VDVQIRLLGRFAVRLGDGEVPPQAFGGRLSQRLVRYLAVHRGSVVARDVLTDVLWPRARPADPDANLNVQVNRARRAVGDGVIETVGDGYALTPAPWCSVDAERFLAAVRAGRASMDEDPAAALATLRGALSLWGGQPLAEDLYEDWAEEWRHLVVQARVQALEAASAAAVRAGEPSAGVDLAQTAVAADPLRETAHVALMRAFAAAGDRGSALASFEELRRRLAAELGVDPSATAARAHLEILRADDAPRTAVAREPAARWADGWPFVGREAEVRQLRDCLDHAGLVLVTGASGSGKSRLLTEVSAGMARPHVLARAFLPARDDPFALAAALLRDLLALDLERGTRLPAPAVAALLPLVPDLAQPVSHVPTVADAEARRALVFEGTLRLLEGAAEDGVALLVDDLQWADSSSLAVLTRAAHRVEGLSMALAFRPGEAQGRALDEHLAGMRRGARHVEEVRLGPLTGEAIRRLVDDDAVADTMARSSDRSPLAVREVIGTLEREGVLEQVAPGRWRARSRQAAQRAAVSVEDGRRAILAGRVEAQPARRRRLLVLLALLESEAGAELLAHAAEQPLEGANGVRDDLDALRQAALVAFHDQGWTLAHDDIGASIRDRLDRPERLRAHARLGAVLAGAAGAERARHLGAAGDALAGAAYAEAARERLDRFATDEAARLADLGLAVAGPDHASHVALLEVRAEAQYRRGGLAAARDDLRRAVRLVASAPVRARLLSRSALLASGADDMALAARLAEHALLEAGDEESARARALAIASVIDMNTGNPGRAEERFREAEQMFARLGDASGVADVLDARVMGTFLAGDLRAAVDGFGQVARLYDEAGNVLRVITPRSTRGHALVFTGDAAAGLVDTEAALRRARDLGHAEGQSYALWHCAEALAALHQVTEAERCATEALRIARSIDHRGWTATAHRALGVVALSTGDLDAAEAAFRRALDISARLDLFSSWAAGGLATVLVRRGLVDAARPLVARALQTGPPLAGYEARLAHAELLAASGDPDAGRVVVEATWLARGGGHGASLSRLRELTAVVSR